MGANLVRPHLQMKGQGLHLSIILALIVLGLIPSRRMIKISYWRSNLKKKIFGYLSNHSTAPVNAK